MIEPMLQELRFVVEGESLVWKGVHRTSNWLVSDAEVFADLMAEIALAGEKPMIDVVAYVAANAIPDPPFQDQVRAELDWLIDGAPIDYRLHIRKESDWMTAASRAVIRVEFYYTPPWGIQTRPIVDLPQKFYIGRCTEEPPPPAKGPKRPCRGCFQEEAPEPVEAPKLSPYELLTKLNGLKLSAVECAERYCVDALGKEGDQRPGDVVDEMVATLVNSPWIRHVYVEVADRRWARNDCSCEDSLDPGWDLPLAGCLEDYFRELLANKAEPGTSTAELTALLEDSLRFVFHAGLRLSNDRLVQLTIVRLAEFPQGIAPCIDVVMGFRVREHQLPGEHGYRFFPSFYHHLFDTMRRTPILEAAQKSPIGFAQEIVAGVHPDPNKYTESSRVVLDNLKSQYFTALAFSSGTRPPALMARSWPRSSTEVLDALTVLLDDPEEGGLGFTWNDWVRFNLKYLEYLTSCGARRKCYEECSWWDFVRGDTYSPTAQVSLTRFPKALVAMDAVEGDARTIGSAGAQTFLDQFKGTGFRDGTLRGPTSEAWLKYWRRYLEAQGVEFVHGKLTHLTVRRDDEGHRVVWPIVECYEPSFPHVLEPDNRRVPRLMTGYFVLALPAHEVQRVAQDSLVNFAEFGLDHRDLRRAARLELGNHAHVKPEGELRHFAGVQFYFEEDVYWIDGHMYFPDSPWALTAISQVRAWEDKHDWEHGYRGVLSVIVGKWDVVGTTVRKPAWLCTPEELAKEVWKQISNALRDKRKHRTLGSELPRPLFWHLDDTFRWTDAGWDNKTPFQIETPGRFHNRPGELDYPGYSTEHGIVLAGTFAKTHTRLTCMEAANESARHAVNAILRDLKSPFRRTSCDIWPIEDREVPDFDFLKSVDQELFDRGLPHAMEIIGTDGLAREFIEPLGNTRWDALDLLTRVGEIVSGWKNSPTWPAWPA
jgi:uncharacterized protein with NAD-binding domain and iron-sulfur cluster